MYVKTRLRCTGIVGVKKRLNVIDLWTRISFQILLNRLICDVDLFYVLIFDMNSLFYLIFPVVFKLINSSDLFRCTFVFKNLKINTNWPDSALLCLWKILIESTWAAGDQVFCLELLSTYFAGNVCRSSVTDSTAPSSFVPSLLLKGEKPICHHRFIEKEGKEYKIKNTCSRILK